MTLDHSTLKRLADAAIEARDKAYAPYSKHPVGSALLGRDGSIFACGNVENAAYPVGTCAEAGAIAQMVHSGQREIVAAVVVGPGDIACTPCGACRQRLNEFAANGDVPVVMVNGAGAVLKSQTVGALLPDSFGPKNLPGT